MTPIRTILHRSRVSFKSTVGPAPTRACSNIASGHAAPSAPPRPVTPPVEASPLSLSLEDINYYGDTIPPSALQVQKASKFFVHTDPKLLITSPYFREFPISPVPEVAFLGRSNVGKSSLLNALIRRTSTQLAHVSKHPGRTRTMNAYGIAGVEQITVRETVDGELKKRKEWKGEQGLVVLDMPGYGKASRDEWGQEILKYMTKREQFQRAFLLIDAAHGLKPTDKQIIELLAAQQIPHQLIISKIDKIIPKIDRACRIIQKEVNSVSGYESCHPVMLVCAAGSSLKDVRRIGLSGVRWAVLEACGLLNYTEQKRTKQRKAAVNKTRRSPEL